MELVFDPQWISVDTRSVQRVLHEEFSYVELDIRAEMFPNFGKVQVPVWFDRAFLEITECVTTQEVLDFARAHECRELTPSEFLHVAVFEQLWEGYTVCICEDIILVLIHFHLNHRLELERLEPGKGWSPGPQTRIRFVFAKK